MINHLGELYAASVPKPMYDPYASVFKTGYPPNPYGNPAFTAPAFVQPQPAFVSPVPAYVAPAPAPFIASIPIGTPQVTPAYNNPFE